MDNKSFRQPIVCVLGHVDHGKTTILDAIRGTTVARKEVGGITQRIGATDIDVSVIEREAKDLLRGGKLKIPGLLFIDTPGHVAFANMRARGGALADIAILVIDINEGLMPQTIESINILKKFRTPFIIAANKIDLIPNFKDVKDISFREAIKKQNQQYQDEAEKKVYDLVNLLYGHGLSCDRYDRIADFSKTVAIVPVSGKKRIGIQDILMVIAGLAQRYLEKEIAVKEIGGRGTIIEVKKEESVGTTLDTVFYQGIIRKGDQIAVNTKEGPTVTKVKAMLINPKKGSKALREKAEIRAASGVRILITDKYEVISGSPLIVVDEKDKEEAFDEIMKETQANIPFSQSGVTVKAEALGSLEAVAYELEQKNIPIRMAEIGDITKRDITDVSTLNDPKDRIIIGFNVDVLPEAKEASAGTDAGVITGNVIYSIIEETEKWLKEKQMELERERKQQMPIPSKITIMPEYIFRATKPVIVGVKIHSGQIKVGDKLIKSDGRYGGTIKSIREGDISKRSAEAPSEVAIAIDGVTLNRQIFPEENLYVDIPESVVKDLREHELDKNTMETLEEIIKIKRKENIFWGTKV